MAGKEDIVFKVSVDEKGKSLADLKKEFKDLQTEVSKATKGSDEYYQSLQKIANVKDEMEDLREEIAGLQGAGRFQAFSNVANTIAGGFQSATAAAALFGAEAQDVQKALLKVQAAASLAEGIRSLEGMAQAFKVLGVIIKGNPIFAVATVILGIAASVKVYADSVDQTVVVTQRLTEENKNLENSLNNVGAAYDRNIAVATAAGYDEIQLIDMQIAKFKEIEKTQTAIAENWATLSLKTKAGTEEYIEYFQKEEEASTKAADAFYKQIELSFRRDAIIDARNKKDAEDREKRLADKKKAKEQNLEPLEDIDLVKELGRVYEEEEQRKIKAKQEYEAEVTRINKALAEQDEAARKRAEEDAQRKKQLEREVFDAKLQLASNSFTAVQMLSDTYFQNQLIAAKGNAAKETEIRKKQFEIDKAFAIARATIDGYRAVTAALTIPPPAGQILAFSNGILAAANVAKIAATKLDGGTNNFSTSFPNTGVSVPNVNTQQSANTPVRNDVTFLDQSGNNLSKVYVTETDISKAQKRVNKIKTQARY